MPHDHDRDMRMNQTIPHHARQTVDDAADQIIATLGPEKRAELSNLKKSGVKTLQMVLGLYTEQQLDNFSIGDNPQDLGDAYAAVMLYGGYGES